MMSLRASVGTGAGSGTVTSVAVATANGLSGTVTNPTTTPNITLSYNPGPNGAAGDSVLLQSGIPFVSGPSGYMQNNGVVIIGQAPANSATVSFSATSGSGVTATFSAATLLGTSGDNGRVLTILDTTYKFFTITAFSSTTVATGTLSTTLSGTGPFANANIWLSAAADRVLDPVAARCQQQLLVFPSGRDQQRQRGGLVLDELE